MRTRAPGPDRRNIEIDDAMLNPYREVLASAAEPAPARLAFAAAHVVLDARYTELGHSLAAPGTADAIAAHLDWSAIEGVRRQLDAHGFGVAEAMDTAQRFYLGWTGAAQLIERCGALELEHGFVAGAGADHLERIGSRDQLIEAVAWQVAFIQRHGGLAILLPLPWLTEQATDADGYVEVYREIFAACDGPLFVHWLGAMFMPALAGYFPGDSFDRVMALDSGKVKGCKLSLLDDALELRVRRELAPRGQIVMTGDDFHFAHLIMGEDPRVTGSIAVGSHTCPIGDFSHALLGAFDGVAAPAGVALRLLAAGDSARYLEVMRPCEALARHVFSEPTQHYKAGLAFLAWLNGWQDNFVLVNREDRARDAAHLLRCAELAAAAGALADAELAATRLEQFAGDRRHP